MSIGRYRFKYKKNTHAKGGFGFYKLLPNVITFCALILGLTAIKYAMSGKFERAVFVLFISGIIDGLDGRIARALGSSSEFGSSLDSLCDMVSFGVCSPLILYIWNLKDFGVLGWCAVVFFSVSLATRLARFNSDLSDSEEKIMLKKSFFQGVPAPFASALNLLPVYISIQFGISSEKLKLFTTLNSFFVSFLTISTIPTISIKGLNINRKNALNILVLINIFMIGLITESIATMIIICLMYLCSIPISVIRYRSQMIKFSNKENAK